MEPSRRLTPADAGRESVSPRAIEKGSELSLLVVGSIALDTIRTPHGVRENALGGSATYFCTAARFFTETRLVGVVGMDFPPEHRRYLADVGADCSGLVVAQGKTFRWSGAYEGDMAQAKTLDVELNVFGDFEPVLPDSFKDSQYVFLANGSPTLQRRVKDQLTGARLVVADTMNLWIETTGGELAMLMREIDGLVLNDAEARQLTGESNLAKAARAIVAAGPTFVVVKKGEHGAMLFDGKDFFSVPAFPTDEVVDPTGAGDSFAGGMMGYLARAGEVDARNLRKALVYGAVIASFAVEDFSVQGLRRADDNALEQRYKALRQMMVVEG